MKKTAKRITAIIISILFIFTMFPVQVFAATETKVLNLKCSDKNFAYEFNNLSDYARYGNKKYLIKVKPGTYHVRRGQQLRLYSNTTVDFTRVKIIHSANDNTLLRLGRRGDDWDNYNKGKGHPGYTGFKNIKIIGGTFDGGGNSQALMRFGHSSNITIEGSSFKNVKNAHMIEIGACKNFVIKKCSFSGFKGKWTVSTNYEAIQFECLTPTGNHFSAYTPNKDETPCKNCTVESCNFKNLQRGIGTHTGIVNSYFTGMKFIKNKFENITGYAISAVNYKNSKINGNTIKNCGAGIVFKTSILDHKNFYASKKSGNKHKKYVKMKSQINNNKITLNSYKGKYKNVAYGIQLFGEKLKKKSGSVPAGDFRCAGVTVKGNTVNLNFTGYGIWLWGAMANTVQGNTVNANIKKKASGGNGDPIRLQGSGKNTVKGNKLYNKTKGGYASNLNGITLYSSPSNKIISNKISKAKKDGINVGYSKGNTISGNKISGSGNNGIGLYGVKSTVITGNTVKSSKGYGIYTSTAKKRAIKTESKNKISKSGKRAKNW